MAVSHISYNKSTEHGILLNLAVQGLREKKDALKHAFAVAVTMIDGNGSDASHFGEWVTRFGFASTAKAKEAYDELNSLHGQIVTAEAAINQAAQKLG